MKKINPRIIIEWRNKKLRKNCMKKCWCKPQLKINNVTAKQ